MRDYKGTVEILNQLVDGIKSYKSTKQICEEIGISNDGVHYYIRKLFFRYGVNNRRSLFLKLKNLPDLIDLPDSPVEIIEEKVERPKVEEQIVYQDRLKIALIGLQRIRERFPPSTTMHQMANAYINKVGYVVDEDNNLVAKRLLKR